MPRRDTGPYAVREPQWRNGRRDRLKICYPQGCGGSSPSWGTITHDNFFQRFFDFGRLVRNEQGTSLKVNVTRLGALAQDGGRALGRS